MPVTSAMVISLWVINDRPLWASCGDAGFGNEPLIASSSTGCDISWLGFRLWTLTVHPRSHIPPKCRLVGCARRVGEAASRPCLWGLWYGKSGAVLCSGSIALWVSAAEIRDWTLLKLRTGTFRNYWAWVRLFIGKKETQYLTDRWGVGPFSQVGSSGSSFCSDFFMNEVTKSV